MPRILAISSSVARGHVGLSAIIPALNRLGHEVIALPTVLLSNHPGHCRSSATKITTETLESMLEVLDQQNWLADIDAVLSGYLPSPQHVDFAAHAIDRVRARSPGARFVCDPILGDDPDGLYIDPLAAKAIRDELLPRADVATPNRFELSWLAGPDVRTLPEAIEAARRLPVPSVLATSLPRSADTLANVLITSETTALCSVQRLNRVPHGTGDFLSSLFVGFGFQGRGDVHALSRAVAGVAHAVAASIGRDELNLIGTQNAWADPKPAEVETIAI